MKTLHSIRRAPRGQRGMAMLYALFGASVSAGLLALLIANTGLDAQKVAAGRTRVEQRFVGEAALSAASVKLQERLANWYRPDTWVAGDGEEWASIEGARQRWGLDGEGDWKDLYLAGVTMVPTGQHGGPDGRLAVTGQGELPGRFKAVGWRVQLLGIPFATPESTGSPMMTRNRMFEVRVVATDAPTWEGVLQTKHAWTAESGFTAALDELSSADRGALLELDQGGWDPFGEPVATEGERRRGQRRVLTRVFQVSRTPTTQFAILYDDDLEINPGPSMTIRGRVHSNADLYLGCNNTLTVDTNYLRAVGGLYRRRKDNTSSNGTVRVRSWVADPFDPSEPSSFRRMDSRGQLGSIAGNVSGYDSAFTLGYDANGDGDFRDSGEHLPFHVGALEKWGASSSYPVPEGQTFPHTVGYGDAHPENVSGVQLPNLGTKQALFDAASEVEAKAVVDPLTGKFSPAAPGGSGLVAGFYAAQADLKVIAGSPIPDSSSPGGWSWDWSAYGSNPDASDPADPSQWIDRSASIKLAQQLLGKQAISVDFVPDTREDSNRSVPGYPGHQYPGVGVVKVDIAAIMELQTALASSSSFQAALQAAGHPPGQAANLVNDNPGLIGMQLQPANGLLYAGHADMDHTPVGGEKTSTGAKAKGVYLTNGEILPGDLTVVTEGSLYVHGDYNKFDHAGNALFNADGNLVGDGLHSNVSAVIADAVNLLSNAWTNNKPLSGSLPKASETTFNLSVYTGNQPTMGSSYNGGFENLPRFHEKWSGRHAFINGSFVQAWQNALATGSWSYGGDRYTAPYRDWVYDTRLLGREPPFVPYTITAREVITF